MVLIIHSVPIFFVIPRSAATKRRISGTFTAERGICCSMRDYQFFAYIMAIKSLVLYTGFSNDLRVRVLQHKIGCFEGFTRRYRVHRLVYFESYRYVRNAIAREKEIKRWVRQRRVALIESMNPRWEDLAAQWFTQEELNREQLAPITVKFDHFGHSDVRESRAGSVYRQTCGSSRAAGGYTESAAEADQAAQNRCRKRLSSRSLAPPLNSLNT
jgi:putative endonuclease